MKVDAEKLYSFIGTIARNAVGLGKGWTREEVDRVKARLAEECFVEEPEPAKMPSAEALAEMREILQEQRRAGSPIPRTCGCKEGQMHTCGNPWHRYKTEPAPKAEECECGHARNWHPGRLGNYCTVCGIVRCPEFRPRVPQGEGAETDTNPYCGCGHGLYWHKDDAEVLGICQLPAGCEHGCQKFYVARCQDKPYHEKEISSLRAQIEEKDKEIRKRGDAIDQACSTIRAKDAEIQRLHEYRENARKWHQTAIDRALEIERLTRINEEFDRGPMETYRRAGQILNIGVAENLDHAATRVMAEVARLTKERDEAREAEKKGEVMRDEATKEWQIMIDRAYDDRGAARVERDEARAEIQKLTEERDQARFVNGGLVEMEHSLIDQRDRLQLKLAEAQGERDAAVILNQAQAQTIHSLRGELK